MTKYGFRVGKNLLRVWVDIERRGQEIQAEGSRPVEDEWEGRKWHTHYRNSLYMYRSTRERAIREGWGEPNQFNVGKTGKREQKIVIVAPSPSIRSYIALLHIILFIHVEVKFTSSK